MLTPNNPPPIASPFPEKKAQGDRKPFLSKKMIRVGLILLSVLLILWSIGEIIFSSIMHEMYFKNT